jgi:hypothetical protein
MGRELQKRKNRTKVPKITKKRRMVRNGHKKIDLGNTLIADNWCVFSLPKTRIEKENIISMLIVSNLQEQG